MGAECNVCGRDIYDECGYCKLKDSHEALSSLYRACREDHDKLYMALTEALSPKHLPAVLRRNGFSDQDIEMLEAIPSTSKEEL